MITTLLNKARALALASAALATVASSAQAHVTLNTPNGGELFTAGQVVTVEWQIAISHNLQNWDLWYSTTGATGPWTVIAMDLPAGPNVVGVPHTYDWTVPDAPSSQVRVRVRMDNSGTNYTDISNANFTIQSGCPSPAQYCSSVPNSSGQSATIGSSGSTSIAANDFVLTASGAAQNTFGIFYYGAAQASIPFGDGLRCVDAGGVGIFRLSPPSLTSPSGDITRPLDFNVAPLNAGAGQAMAGSVWNFQLWFRDAAAGGAGFNLTDALSVTFCQ